MNNGTLFRTVAARQAGRMMVEIMEKHPGQYLYLTQVAVAEG